MIKHKLFALLFTAGLFATAIAQPTNAVTDPEKKYKDAKELFVKEQFALAYPLFKELKEQYQQPHVPE
jgi:hypothetical protein